MLRSSVALVGLSVLLVACGGDSPVDPLPKPPTPDKASLAVTYVGGSAKLGLSKDPRYSYALRFQVQIAESAGLDVHADYVRLQLLLHGVEIERSEISAADIVAGAGSNLIPGGSSRTWTLTLRFNEDRWNGFNLFFHFTDSKRNGFTATVPRFSDIESSPQALKRHLGREMSAF